MNTFFNFLLEHIRATCYDPLSMFFFIETFVDADELSREKITNAQSILQYAGFTQVVIDFI